MRLMDLSDDDETAGWIFYPSQWKMSSTRQLVTLECVRCGVTLFSSDLERLLQKAMVHICDEKRVERNTPKESRERVAIPRQRV